ncbi:Voltage-dependent T-type calcium channel subunit alpha-1H, partial [Goodea atripinnis]
AKQRPYYADYSPLRLTIHTLCTSHYLDLFITFIICINVFTMSIEHYNQPQYLEEVLKYCNYVFTIIFVIEALLKLVAFGFHRFFKDSAKTSEDGKRNESSAGYGHASTAAGLPVKIGLKNFPCPLQIIIFHDMSCLEGHNT